MVVYELFGLYELFGQDALEEVDQSFDKGAASADKKFHGHVAANEVDQNK